MSDTTPKPLGPNDAAPPPQKQEWPGWFTGPEGQRRIFNSPEEVPDDWTDELPRATTGLGLPTQRRVARTRLDELRNEEAREAAVDKLIEDHTQAELISILEKMNEEREVAGEDEIEFLNGWPKLKLATAIVDNAPEEADEEGGEEGEAEAETEE